MNRNEIELLAKLGINVLEISNPLPNDNASISGRGTFFYMDGVLGPMSRLIKITDMIVESKNPAVNEMYEQLITMLNLTKEE